MDKIENKDFEDIYDESSESTEKPEGIDNEAEGIYKIAVTQWPAMKSELERCKNKLGYKFNYEIIGKDVVHQKHLTTNNPFDYSIYGKIKPYWTDGDDIPVYKVHIVAEIENEKWQVIAIADHVPTQKGIHITPIVQDVEIPKEYYFYDGIKCDHCHTNRDRSQGIIVKNKETGEIRMVGKSCIREYTALNAADILALHNVFEIVKHWDPMGGSRNQHIFDTEYSLLVAYAAIKANGYHKKEYNGYGYSETDESTSKIMKEVLNLDLRDLDKQTVYVQNTVKYIENNKDNIRKALPEMLKFLKSMDAGDDKYKQAIKTCLSGEVVSDKQFGVLASAPLAYIRFENEQELKKTSAELNLNNEFYGNVGDKVNIDNITKIIPGKKTIYGSYLVTIISKDGYKFTAFVDSIPKDLDKIVKVTGQISRHSEFRGEKSTTLKYVTFIRNPDEGDPASKAEFAGNVGDKVHVEVESYDVGPVQSSSFGYNQESYYAKVTINGKDGNIYVWSCPNEKVYNKEVELKSFTATIKQNITRSDGVKMNKIGGRVKINESEEIMEKRLFESEDDDAELMTKYYDAIDAGIITDDMSFDAFKHFGAENVIEFCKLAEQGAFDKTATIKDFIEYGAQNLNDLNVLKHKKLIFPSLTMSQCFDLGSDKAIEVSKKMFEAGCDEDKDVYEFLGEMN